MALNFPSYPVAGQTYTSGSLTFLYDGTSWTNTDAVRVGSSDVSGLTHAGNPNNFVSSIGGKSGNVTSSLSFSSITSYTNTSSKVYEFYLNGIPANWKRNDSTVLRVEIGNVVTSIGSYAFEYCSVSYPIIIPNSVTTISDSAFHLAESLPEITIPSSITSIGNYAFNGCTLLKTASIYVTKTLIDGSSLCFYGSGLGYVRAPSSDGTWSAGTNITVGGKTGVTVVKDL